MLPASARERTKGHRPCAPFSAAWSREAPAPGREHPLKPRTREVSAGLCGRQPSRSPRALEAAEPGASASTPRPARAAAETLLSLGGRQVPPFWAS